MGRRSVHTPEELRQLILDASQTIIERNGIDALSAREIARMIGYSPGTLYNIFDNLDDVLMTLQVQLMARTVEHLKEVPMGSDPATNLQAISDAYIDFALANRRMWNLLLAHALPAQAPLPTPYPEQVNGLISIVTGALQPLTEPASEGRIDTLARVLWAGLHGIAAVAATEKGVYLTPATAKAYAKELTTTFIKGLERVGEKAPA
jgi:AcrR family transcriptional regulator